MNQACVVLTTAGSQEEARKIARSLVERQIAACVNIVPQVESIYRWQGKVESADEALAIFKLDAACYAKFETTLRSLHPYDVPEIIAYKIDNGLPEYLRWVTESCAT